jgi:uncharacterized membrane protein YoaK (UPF0700 family)
MEALGMLQSRGGGRRPRVLVLREKAALAVTLTWVAGFVDVVGYVLFRGIYTANMSGNTIDVGRALPNATIFPMLRHLSAILFFVVGMIAGRLVVDYASRHNIRAIASLTLAIEAAMLAALMYWGSAHQYPAEPWPFYGLIGLAALAMGFQNITVNHVGALTVYTCFVTGALTKFAQSFSRYLFWFRDRTEHRFKQRVWKVMRLSTRNGGFQESCYLACVWLAYAGGAASGWYARQHWDLFSLAAPVGVLVAVIVIDLIRPVSVEQEKQD